MSSLGGLGTEPDRQEAGGEVGARCGNPRPGLFTWGEWAQTLAGEIARAQRAGDPDTGETYYHRWLAALERIVAEKGAAESETLARYRDAWDHAAKRTRHGDPIVLQPEDFGG